MKKFFTYFVTFVFCASVLIIGLLSIPAFFYISDPQEIKVDVTTENSEDVLNAVCILAPLKQIRSCRTFLQLRTQQRAQYAECYPENTAILQSLSTAEKEKITSCIKEADTLIQDDIASDLRGKTLILKFE